MRMVPLFRNECDERRAHEPRFLRACARGTGGRIISVPSESALQIPAEMTHYGMTKTAQIAVARGRADDLRGQWHDGERGLASADGGGRSEGVCRVAAGGEQAVE
jgi:hypothetical protein